MWNPARKLKSWRRYEKSDERKDQLTIECKIFPFGPHGMALSDGTGLGKSDPHAARWADMAVEWLKLYGFQGEKR